MTPMNLWEPILAMIMALTSFSIKANPKAPGPDVVLEHRVDDADLFVHVDLKPTLVDNYAVWQKLAEDPLVKQTPSLRDAVRDATVQAEGGRAMVKGLVGIDLATDLTSVTAFGKVSGNGPPDFLIVIRGNLAADLPQRLTQNLGGKTETIDGRIAAVTPDGMMIGTSKSGAVLVGARALVAPRLADAWKASARTKGSSWAQIASVLDGKPFFVVAAKPSPAALAHAGAAVPPGFGRDLLSQAELVVLSATSTGIGWVYQAKDAAFAARMKLASEGWIELMRAAHVAPRGIAELIVAALPSYAGQSPELDDAIKHKDQILAAVNELTGDGKFQSTVKLSGNVVTVTTKGRRLTDVVPLGLVVGLGGLGAAGMAVKAPAQASPAHGSSRPGPARPVTPARPSTTTPPKPLPPKPTPAPRPSTGARP